MSAWNFVGATAGALALLVFGGLAVASIFIKAKVEPGNWWAMVLYGSVGALVLAYNLAVCLGVER